MVCLEFQLSVTGILHIEFSPTQRATVNMGMYVINHLRPIMMSLNQ